MERRRTGLIYADTRRTPWNPTREFPHPLCRIVSSNISTAETNLLSYTLVDLVLWRTISSRVNAFREKVLGLDHLDGQLSPLASRRIPAIYFWYMTPLVIDVSPLLTFFQRTTAVDETKGLGRPHHPGGAVDGNDTCRRGIA